VDVQHVDENEDRQANAMIHGEEGVRYVKRVREETRDSNWSA
jgi:hypothetical protein